jgi:hypothetical protein
MKSKIILILIALRWLVWPWYIFGLDPGKFIRFLAGEYTSHHQDVHCTLNTVQDYITPDNHKHVK